MKSGLAEKRRRAVEGIVSGLDETYIMEAVSYKSNKGSVLFWGCFRKAAVAILMAGVLGISGITVAAACGYAPAMELLSRWRPDFARQIKPVNESCIDNGIEMKVEGIYIEDNAAKVYISMKDLTGDRIDATTDLFDSYSIHTKGIRTGGCEFVAYDDVNKMSYFLITLQNEKGNPVKGEKMTFSVSRFLSHKMTTESSLPEINLNEIPLQPEMRDAEDEQLRLRGSSGGVGNGQRNILQYNDAQAFSPVEGVCITAWGMVGDAFHIQVYYEDILNFDNHGSILLKDAGGGEYVYPETYSYFDADNVGSYEEYVFLPDAGVDWKAYALEATFWTCRNLTEGNWEVTFPIEDMNETK